MRVLISGGGIAGLTLAYWLHQYGCVPIVIDQAEEIRREGYAIDFFGTGYDVAERMDLIARLQPQQVPIEYVAFEEAEVKVLAYARQHPRLIRYLPRLLGYRTDGTEEDLRALARLGIVVAFEPITMPASAESRVTPVESAPVKKW